MNIRVIFLVWIASHSIVKAQRLEGCGDTLPLELANKLTDIALPQLKDTLEFDKAIQKYFLNGLLKEIDWYFISINFHVSKKGNVYKQTLYGNQPSVEVRKAISDFMETYLKTSKWYFNTKPKKIKNVKMEVTLVKQETKKVIVSVSLIYTQNHVYQKTFFFP